MSDLSDARTHWLALAAQTTRLRDEERRALEALLAAALGPEAEHIRVDVTGAPDGGWTIHLRPALPVTDHQSEPAIAPEPDTEAPDREAEATETVAPTPFAEDGDTLDLPGGPLPDVPTAAPSRPEGEGGRSGAPDPAHAEADDEPAGLAPLPEIPTSIPPVDARNGSDAENSPATGVEPPPLAPVPQTPGTGAVEDEPVRSDAPEDPFVGLPPLPGQASTPPTPPDPAAPAAPRESAPVAPAPPSDTDEPSARSLGELLDATDDTLRLSPPARRENPYLNASTDPVSRAERLARTLVGDMVVYRSEAHQAALRDGPDALRTAFTDEIATARAEFMRQIEPGEVDADTIFNTALNEVFAHGQSIF